MTNGTDYNIAGERLKSQRQIEPEVDLAFAAKEPTDADRRHVTDLALRALRKEAEIIAATSVLQLLKSEYHQLTEVDLPKAMEEIGQLEFKLLDGTPVVSKSKLQAGQLSDYGETPNIAGLAWVEKNGGASLVRATITAEFDAKDIKAAREVYEMIRKHPAANRLKTLKFERCVLWNTLTNWVGQLVDAHRDPPLELLRVRWRNWVQVGKRSPETVKITGFAER